MADSSRHSMGLVAESTYGTTPATPAFKPIRHLGTTLATAKDALVAQELRADRQITDHQYGVRQVGGDITMELNSDGGNANNTVGDMLEAVLGGTWATDVLKAGVTRRPFSILRQFEDTTTGRYHLYTGCEFNTLAITNGANQQVQMTLGVIGQDQSVGDSAPAGATFPTGGVEGQMTGILGSVNEGGGAIGVVTEASFTLENGLEIRPVIGSQLTLEPSIGRSNATGQIVVYYEDSSLLAKFLSETESSLDFTTEDADGNQYVFDFPKIKYSGGDVPVSGQGAVTLTMPFQALYDTVETTNLKITRVEV